MPILLNVLDQYFLSDAPGASARSALPRAFERASGTPWNELYVEALDDAVREELPNLSAYAGPRTSRPTRAELQAALAAELGDNGAELLARAHQSGTFLTELARAMQTRRLLLIDGKNLFTDEYRQLLLNLFDHVHARLKRFIVQHEPEFSAALADATGNDPLLFAATANYLARIVGVTLVAREVGTSASHPVSAVPPPPPPVTLADPEETPQGLLARARDASARGDARAALALVARAQAGLTASDDALRAQLLYLELIARRQLAEDSLNRGDFVQAHAHSAQRLDLAQELRDPALQAEAYHDLGRVMYAQDNFDDALDLYAQAAAHVPASSQDERTRIERDQCTAYEKLGDRERAAKNYAPAETMYRSALARAESLDDKGREAAILYTLGLIAIEQEHWAQALDELRRALDIANALPAAPDKPKLLWNIGRAQRGLKRQQMSDALRRGQAARARAEWQAAEKEYQTALQLARELGDANVQAIALEHLGEAAQAQGAWGAAIDSYQAALATLSEGDSPDARARLWRALMISNSERGTAQRIASDMVGAEASYNSAMTAALECSDRVGAGELAFLLGTLAADQKAWDRALGNYAIALEYLDAPETQNERRDVMRYQAAAFQQWGDSQRAADQFDAAASAYRSAYARAEEVGDADGAGQALYRFGLLDAARGNWEGALAYYQAAEARLDPDNSETRAELSVSTTIATRARRRDELNAQLEHARAAQTERQWDDAATAYRAALPIADAISDSHAVDRIQNELVAVYADKANTLRQIELWEEATAAYRESLLLARQFGLEFQQRQRETDLLSLANERVLAQLQAHDWETAHVAADTQLALARELGDAQAEADALYHLGVIAHHTRDWARAKAYYEEARPFFARAEKSAVLVELDNDLAAVNEALARAARCQTALAEGERARAQARYKDATLSYRAALELARDLDDAETAARCRAALVAIAVKEANALDAEKHSGAAAAYQRAIAVAQEFQNFTVEADAWFALGEIAEAQRDWHNAATFFTRAARAYEQLEDNWRVAEAQKRLDRAERILARQERLAACLMTARRAQSEKEWNTAVQSYAEAEVIAGELGAFSTQADARLALYEIAVTERRWADALDEAERACESLDSLEQPRRVAALHAERARLTRSLKQEQCAAARRRGDERYHAGDWATASAAYQEALDLARQLDDARTVGELHFKRGQVANAEHRWDAAAAEFAIALTLFTQPADFTQRTAALEQQMVAWLASGDRHAAREEWALAREAYALARGNAEQLGNRMELARLARRFGAVSVREDDLPRARAEYQTAAEIIAALPAPDERLAVFSEYAAVWQQVGDRASSAREFARSEAAYLQALALNAEIDAPTQRAQILYRLGLLYTAQANWQAARDTLERANELMTDADDPALATDILVKLADAELQLGTLEAARKHYAGALRIVNAYADPEREGELQLALGATAARQADWQTALVHYAAARETFQANGILAPLAAIARHQADAQVSLGAQLYAEAQWRDAQMAFTQALNLDREAGRTDRLADLYMRRGRAAAAQEDFFAATRDYARALALMKQDDAALRDRILPLLAFALQQEGKRAQQAGEWEYAQSTFQRAITIAKASNHFEQTADLYGRLGFALAEQGKWHEALTAYREAVSWDERVGDSLRAKEFNAALAPLSLRLARETWDARNVEQAEFAFRDALTAAEHAEEPALAADAQAALGECAAARGDIPKALEWFARAARTAADLEIEDKWRSITLRQAELLSAAAAECVAANRLADAENAYRRALALQQAAGNPKDAQIHLELGRVFSLREEWQTALAELDQADKQLAVDAPQHDTLRKLQVRALEESGAQAAAALQRQDASAAYLRAATYCDELGERARAGRAWEQLAQIAVAQNDWHAADAANQEALARLDALEHADARQRVLAQQAKVLVTLGAVYVSARDGTRADEIYSRAVAVAQETKDRAELARLYRLRGEVAADERNWDAARHHYEHAVEMYEKLEQPLALAETWMQLGEIHRQAAQFDAASDAFARAGALYHEEGDTRSEAASWLRRGQVQADSGGWDNALAEYQHALALVRQAGDRTFKFQVYDGFTRALRGAQEQLAEELAADGESALKAGNAVAAEAAYRDALTLYDQAGDRALRAQMENQLGLALEEQERWQDALGFFQSALREFEQLEAAYEFTSVWRAAQGSVLHNIGNVSEKLGAFAEAQDAYARALGVAREIGDPESEKQLSAKLAGLQKRAVSNAA